MNYSTRSSMHTSFVSTNISLTNCLSYHKSQLISSLIECYFCNEFTQMNCFLYTVSTNSRRSWKSFMKYCNQSFSLTFWYDKDSENSVLQWTTTNRNEETKRKNGTWLNNESNRVMGSISSHCIQARNATWTISIELIMEELPVAWWCTAADWTESM